MTGTKTVHNPFGFHFYGLVYARLMGDRDPERASRYIERARLFAPQFIAWFRDDGSIVPYGRRLTRRFGGVSFFSTCAFTGVEALPWPVMHCVMPVEVNRDPGEGIPVMTGENHFPEGMASLTPAVGSDVGAVETTVALVFQEVDGGHCEACHGMVRYANFPFL